MDVDYESDRARINNLNSMGVDATVNRQTATELPNEQDDWAPARGKTVKVALPDYFNGDPKDFKRFRRTYGVYICVNDHLFDEDYKKILFVLSYMRNGRAGVWADDFVENATTQEYWGTWEEFKGKLTENFSDQNEARRAIEEIEKLRQGRGTAADYFMNLERLANVAEIAYKDDVQILARIEKGLHPKLVDRLYQSDHIPTAYADLKRKAIQIDELWLRRQELRKDDPRPTNPFWKKPHIPMKPKATDEAMDVDNLKEKPRKTITCFKCGEKGHIARHCKKTFEARETKAEEGTNNDNDGGWGSRPDPSWKSADDEKSNWDFV